MCHIMMSQGTSIFADDTPSSVTNPVNLYGKSKRDGEVAVLSVSGAKVIILRVPVL